MILEEITADDSQLHPSEYMEPLPESGEDERAEILKRLFLILFPARCNQDSRLMEVTFRRFCALTYIIAPERMAGQTMTEVAAQLGFTIAAFSKITTELSAVLGLEGRALRSASAREAHAIGQATRGAEPPKRVQVKDREAKGLREARIYFERGRTWLAHHRRLLRSKGYINESNRFTTAGIQWLDSNQA